MDLRRKCSPRNVQSLCWKEWPVCGIPWFSWCYFFTKRLSQIVAFSLKSNCLLTSWFLRAVAYIWFYLGVLWSFFFICICFSQKLEIIYPFRIFPYFVFVFVIKWKKKKKKRLQIEVMKSHSNERIHIGRVTGRERTWDMTATYFQMLIQLFSLCASFTRRHYHIWRALKPHTACFRLKAD